MAKALYKIVKLIAVLHNYIFFLNRKFGFNFDDKTLHFLVIGACGLSLYLLTYPLFKYLSRKGKIKTITFIFVLSQVIGLSFAIEIGQKITNTGNMEFQDIVFGISGFIFMYLVLNIIIWTIEGFKKIIQRIKH